MAALSFACEYSERCFTLIYVNCVQKVQIRYNYLLDMLYSYYKYYNTYNIHTLAQLLTSIQAECKVQYRTRFALAPISRHTYR